MVEAPRMQETSEIHTRIMKCALEVEATRAYWAHATPGAAPSSAQAFAEGWFGSRSLARVKVLLTNLNHRFGAFPPALGALHAWADMDADTRALVCHWHLQLTDVLYRGFTAEFLPERRARLRATVDRDHAVDWVTSRSPARWTMATRVQIASKLLSCAFEAGLLGGNRDPRPVLVSRVPDDALAYLLYLLREVDFAGDLLNNPYLRSVGLEGDALDERLRRLSALAFGVSAGVVDLGWRYPSLTAWAEGA